jgi:uncharacterized Zn finger protein
MGWWYEPTQRRHAKGGIKAQSKSGAFGQSWWAKRWIATLESFDLGARLTRGRSYARSGQVLSIDIAPGQVRAKVQGSQVRPYGVDIKVKTLSEEEWRRVAEALSGQALFAAKLMAGEMPDTIEEAFQSIGLSLFPARMQDIATDCTCPDWSNPCKHIAAVYYLLGEEFDRDPFLIFRMRGMTREAFLALLGERSGPAREEEEEAALPPEPLAANGAAFWEGQTLPEDLFGEVSVPPVTAALLRRLGNFPFWRGEQSLQDTLIPCYSRASRRGLDLFVGEMDTSG